MTTKRNSIYKVNHLVDKDTIKTIYVFFGNNLDVKKPNELFKQDPRNAAFVDKVSGQHIFNDEELAKILDKTKPIDVRFSKQQIHFDDSIGTIKIKILAEFPNSFSLEQIYLFCLKEEKLNSTNIYQTLTQNNRLELTKVRLNQFIMNIYKEANGAPVSFTVPEKQVYNYDDILDMNLNGNSFLLTKVLGQKFFIVSNEYPFVCNPFDATEYDPFIERAARKSLSTLNSHLLLNTGDINNNNIYLCLAEDVLLRAKDSGLSEENTINIYYPFLSKSDIHTYEELEKQKYELIEKNKTILKPATLNTFESVNMFYDVYKYRTETNKYKYKGNGIKFIKLSIKPEFIVKIPLDVIFKIIHATDGNPLIKFNPSTKQENIYRLYADKTSTDGRKIPMLPKSNIFKLMRDIGKTKSVSVYVDNVDGISLLTCDFEDNGTISITCDCEKIMSLETIETVIKTNANPIIQEVKNFLEQSGYTISLYTNIYNENVDVKQLDYQTAIEITKPIKISEFMGCITSAFIVESKNLKAKTGINMRFKRVSNFNKTTSQEAFVIEQANNKDGLKGQELVLALIENYRMTESDARYLIQKLASEVQVERGVRKTDIEIKMNPGFKTNITLNSITSTITITVENINDIYYLNTIPIYLDSFIRLTQDKKSTLVPTKTINSLCSGEENVELQVDEIVAPSEQAFPEQEIPVIEGEDMDFEPYSEYIEGVENFKEPKFANALDLIYGDGDEEEDEEEEQPSKGGQVTSSSDASSFHEGVVVANDLPSSSDESKKSGIGSLSTFGDSLPSSTPTPPPVEAPVVPPKVEKVEKVEKAKPVAKKVLKLQEKEEEDNDEDQVRDIVGMRLKNPTPFASKMYELDPTLFLKEDKGKFSRYSRSCSSSAKKQPVLITEEEMQELKDEEYAKIINKYGKEKFETFSKEKQQKIIQDESFLRPEDVIKYGSDPDNKYYYVCPRYWCLKTNKPIDPKEMVDVLDTKTGKMVKRHPTCGGIISDGQDEVKNDGNYVYEFFDATEHGSREKYKKHFPGFLKSDKHPDGLCIPCCFTKWNTPGQIGRRKECAQAEKEKEKEEEKQKESESKVEKLGEPATILTESASEQPRAPERVVEKDNYVKGPEKFPLDIGRWGYLQYSIQNFFQEASSTCQISKTNTNIKPNQTCLLRHGVEFSEKQSFIACIADAKYYGDTPKIPSIKEMKQTIINSLNIDDYITYQNGNNVTSFMVDDFSHIGDLSKYKDSALYKRIFKQSQPTVPSEENYFKGVVASYENFIAYLNDATQIIDYTYLWDIICRPNPALFPQGINLIIMDIVNNDSTNNIELICPTNHYSNEFYNPSKQSLFIVKMDDLYEPIYSYENKVKTTKVVKTFSELSLSLQANIRAIFKKIIKPVLQDTCGPLPSMPNVYKYKEPILLSKLIAILHKKKYDIEKQILNYQSKVIGLYVSKGGEISGYVPCYPSSADQTYPNMVFMDDASLYSTYERTLLFLNTVYKDTKGAVPIKPEFKIVEDEHVVGILTETNQFIQLSEPMPISNVRDSMPTMNDNNYVVSADKTPLISSDYAIATSEENDSERTAYVKKIKLETNFYNVFRNTIRILLNDYENIKTRETIESVLNKPYILYSVKLNEVVSLLKKLVGDTNSVVFDNSYDYSLINSVSSCIVLPKDKCDAKRPVCAFTSNNKCKIIIPRNNLLSSKYDNETLYFGKMADELIRYSRIKSFIFQPQTYLSFGSIGYNLRENEIIVIQSLLTKDYFDGLIPEVKNKYVTYNTYDTAEPKYSQVYDNTVVINETPNLEAEVERKNCFPVETHISSKIWKDSFPPDFKELYYEDANCGFYLLIDIILEFTKNILKINELKAELLEEYNKYLAAYGDQIIDILILEGKKTQGLRVKQKTLSFQHFIYSEDYYITNLDIWMIMSKYKIPSIIISSKPILLTKKEKTALALYGDLASKFVFIFSPAMRAENIPKYSIIFSMPDHLVFHPLNVIESEETLREVNETVENILTVEEFLQSFTKKALPKKAVKKSAVKLVLQHDDRDVEPAPTFPTVAQTKKQKTTVVVAKPKQRSKKNIKFAIEE